MKNGFITESEFLKKIAAEKGDLSLPAFCEKLKGELSPQFVSSVLIGKKHPSDTLAKAMGYERVICFRKRTAKAKAKKAGAKKPKAEAKKAA